MVKAKKKKMTKKKEKMMKKKGFHDMFLNGGLDLFILGGFIGITYETLYFLITVETQMQKEVEEVSYAIFRPLLQELGILLLFFGLIFICYFILKEQEFFKKSAGSFFIAGAILTIAAFSYSQYEVVKVLKGASVPEITVKSFVTTTVPAFMDNFSKIYFFVGMVVLGIFLWGHSRERRYAAEFFMGGAVMGCVAIGTLAYGLYENYKMFLEMYATSRDLIISQFIIPDVLENTAELLVIIGIFLFSASYIWTESNFRKWSGRTLFSGGAVGTFNGFIRLGVASGSIRSEITQVRQSVMDLTPFTTNWKGQALTIETLKEFYVKKMMPVYLEYSLLIVAFAGIVLIGIYLWMRE